MHWCISCRTALAEAEVEYDEKHVSPSIDVRFPLSRRGAGDAGGQGIPALHGPPRVRGHLDHHALDAARQPRPRLPSRRRLRVLSRRGHGRRPAARQGAARVRGSRAGTGSKPARSASRSREVKGAALEGLRFRHPWIDRDSPGVLGDYVTLDTGTGVVHTAPGHGWDDYLTGVRYGLDIYCPVDEAGRFLPEVEHFAGQKVFDANPEMVALLREKGALLGSGKETHSYPVCWRCKNPIIFRATEQWFIGLDRDGLARARARRHRRGALVPRLGRGAHPQHDRGPPRLVHLAPAAVGRAHPRLLLPGLRRGASCTPTLARRVADLFETESADAWYEREAADLLPAGLRLPAVRRRPSSTRRRTSSTSGSTPAPRTPPCSARRPGPALAGRRLPRGQRPAPRLVPLLAAHRRGHARARAPYRAGGHPRLHRRRRRAGRSRRASATTWTPRSSSSSYGAEILRLWTIMVDYREDMRFSEEMLKRRGRGLPQGPQHLPLPALEPLRLRPRAGRRGGGRASRRSTATRWRATARSWPACSRPTTTYEFHVVYHQLVQYCAVDLSSFYLDVLKDRLYCDAAGRAAAPLRADRAAPHGAATWPA